MSSTIQSKRIITCSACSKTGHNKSSPKYHPIVPKEVPLLTAHPIVPKEVPLLTAHQIRQKEEINALIAKHVLENLDYDSIEPMPAPVFLPRKHRGECGLENGKIHFPLTHMGCSEDARGVVMTVTIQFNQSRVGTAIIKQENDA